MAEFNSVFVPKLTPVNSSNIKAIGYDGTDLYVEYLSGRVYQYKSVPQQLFEDMQVATSKGAFMNAYIKGKFTYDFLK